jgi:hypothetical protein
MIKKLHYGMVVKDEYGEEFVVGKYNKSFDIDANSYKVLLTSELHKVALYSSDLISLLNEGRYSLITDMKDNITDDAPVIVKLNLETLWMNFMLSLAESLWEGWEDNELFNIVSKVILTGEKPVNPIELTRLFSQGMTALFLREEMIKIDICPPRRSEIHIQDDVANCEYIIPSLFVKF